MICTYGAEGLRRVAESSHPKVAGVEYLVSWQTNDCHNIPHTICRDDFKIFPTDSKGLSINRNTALSLASAPLLLLSDDDVDYTEEGLKRVIEAFRIHPDQDLLAFRYESSSHTKNYPSAECDLSDGKTGYYPTSFEIAFRRDSVKGSVWFNENFGIGAIFPFGEEDLFVRDCLDNGLKGSFIPMTICRHEGSTTSARNLMLASRPQTKGAVFLKLHPCDWPLRMLTHTLREIPLWRNGLVPFPLSFCHNWIKGVMLAKMKKVFPTPDYSKKYPGHV